MLVKYTCFILFNAVNILCLYLAFVIFILQILQSTLFTEVVCMFDMAETYPVKELL